MTEVQHKPWYKHWWGIIIAILIWPYFLIWLFWAKSKWSWKRKGLITAAVPIMFIIIVGVLSPNGANNQQPVNSSNTATHVTTKQTSKKQAPTQSSSKKTTTATKPTTTSTAATATSSQPPTESIATLNAQAVALFNPVLSDLEQQMSQGQADAAQSNAANVSSSWHSWDTAEEDKQNVTNNNEVTAAYNKADNAYFDSHQTAPSAIDNWDTDAGDIPGDISDWANDEQLVIGDELFGTSSSSDQQQANTAMQQYKTDLAHAQTDVSQL